MEIVWNIPSERALDRIEELEAFVERFPESPLAPAFKNEIEQLQSLCGIRSI